MKRLESKVAIITGGSGGQGASHARRFVKEGAQVVFTDINEEAGEKLEAELGEQARFIKHDVTKMEDWERVIEETESHFGPVNILVNNAGIAVADPIKELTEEDFRKVMEINTLSVFLGTKAVVPSMKKAGSGSIVNVSSGSGLIGLGGVGYVASKFAVRGITKATALELVDDNIRVNSFHPGAIDTPMIQGGNVQEVVDSMNIPMNRVAEPHESTNLVLYLASDESSYSTGSEFVMDGGVTAQ